MEIMSQTLKKIFLGVAWKNRHWALTSLENKPLDFHFCLAAFCKTLDFNALSWKPALMFSAFCVGCKDSHSYRQRHLSLSEAQISVSVNK